MRTFIILRGVSGAGKSTVASLIEELALGNKNGRCVVATADDYFMKDGEYKFNPAALGKAHEWCRERVDFAMSFNVPVIILANTSTSEKEFNPYIEMAGRHNYQIVSLIVENRHGNSSIHNVPEKTLVGQEERIVKSIKLR